jgi:NAD(P)-dependent dehydrogenase (short-subunit alcohol dehydrogenase family)
MTTSASPHSGPSFRLDDRMVLVTGASSGLGRHFALMLAAAGARVALAARRLDKLEEVAAEIRSSGGTAHAVEMDVTRTETIKAGFDAAEKALGPVRVLVNNAGVPAGTAFVKTTDEEWRRILDVNLDGVFRVGREAAQRMQAHKQGGSIINIASIIGLGALRTLTPYMASKAAVIHLTKGMALELARDNIRVNALAPGYISTEFNEEFLASDAGQKLMAKIPIRRFGKAQELDGPLLLLASDAGSLMTGTVVTVDGGHLLSMG